MNLLSHNRWLHKLIVTANHVLADLCGPGPVAVQATATDSIQLETGLERVQCVQGTECVHI